MRSFIIIFVALSLSACSEDITEEHIKTCIRDFTHPKRKAFCECSLAELRKIASDEDIIEFVHKGLTRAITLEQLDDLEERCRIESGYSYN